MIDLAPEKIRPGDQKGLMKGEDLRVLEETTQLTHKRSF